MRIVVASIAILLIASSLLAQSIPFPGPGRGVIGGGSITSVDTDNFSGTLAKWTSKVGSWGDSGGFLAATNAAAAVIWFNSVPTSPNQWIEAKTYINSGSMQFIFWSSADANPPAAYMGVTVNQTSMLFYYINTTQVGSTCSVTWVDGHYLGIKVVGPSTSASVYVYDNGTSTVSPASWTAPVCSWTGQNLQALTPTPSFGNGTALYDLYNNTSHPQIDDWKVYQQ